MWWIFSKLLRNSKGLWGLLKWVLNKREMFRWKYFVYLSGLPLNDKILEKLCSYGYSVGMNQHSSPFSPFLWWYEKTSTCLNAPPPEVMWKCFMVLLWYPRASITRIATLACPFPQPSVYYTWQREAGWKCSACQLLHMTTTSFNLPQSSKGDPRAEAGSREAVYSSGLQSTGWLRPLMWICTSIHSLPVIACNQNVCGPLNIARSEQPTWCVVFFLVMLAPDSWGPWEKNTKLTLLWHLLQPLVVFWMLPPVQII